MTDERIIENRKEDLGIDEASDAFKAAEKNQTMWWRILQATYDTLWYWARALTTYYLKQKAGSIIESGRF